MYEQAQILKDEYGRYVVYFSGYIKPFLRLGPRKAESFAMYVETVLKAREEAKKLAVKIFDYTGEE